MLRRKLALYTLLYIAGITAGFFIFERSRIIEAAGFCAAVFAALIFTNPAGSTGIFSKNEKKRHSSAISQTRNQNYDGNFNHHPNNNLSDNSACLERHLNYNHEELKKQKAILAMLFLTGLLLFTLRSLSYNSAMSYVHDKNYLRGKVIDASVKDDKIRLTIKNSEPGPGRVLVILDGSATIRPTEHAGSEAYRYIGRTVEVRGEYSEIQSDDNPGCFDYALYMKSKGIPVRLKAYIIEVTSTKVPFSNRAKLNLYDARESFISRFDTETQGFIRGVIFGDKSEIDEETLEEFNSNSTGHILAVSGLHIGFLYGLLRFLTSHKRTLPVSLLIITVIFLYGEMTMWSPATLRACIVMTISLLGSHLRRCSDLLTSLSLAAFLILTYQPYQLFNSGFQMSFLALSSIAFLTGPISSVTGEGIAVLLAVQIGTMPVIAYTYCSINPLSILINIPIILLSSVLVPLCIFLLMLEIWILRVPAAGISLAELLSYAVIKTNHFLSFDGGFSIRTAGPGAAVIVVFYATVFVLASEWTRVVLLRKDYRQLLKQGILLLMPLTMLFSCMYDSLADDEIVFVAVGQGDCVHIRADGHNVLIDGGGQTDTGNKDMGSGSSEENQSKNIGYNTGKSILMPYLLHAGADAVDIALVTHLHADHYKGIVELSGIYPVGAIGIPIDYRDSTFQIDSSKIYFIRPNTTINISKDVTIDVLWPVEVSDEPVAADDPNEHNTVYMIRYNGIKIMVTGDLLEADELEMVRYYQGTDALKCDILKVAHHGSKSSSSEEFLDAASPRIAVIQVGRNNFYGHPHQQTLERLIERGIKVYRTDLNGAIGIDIHLKNMSVDLFKK